MISYGSQQDCTPMSPCDRSHQLGEGQSQCAEMPVVRRPSRLVLGSQILIAKTLCGKRSHQLGEGHQCGAEMPTWTHPPRLVLESQGSGAEMPMRDRSQGKGHHRYAEMPRGRRPSQPVYGSRNHNAAMPMEKRSHLFTRGHRNIAEMPMERSPPKGRANKAAQQCQWWDALPHQFWATFTTQKCQLIFAQF